MPFSIGFRIALVAVVLFSVNSALGAGVEPTRISLPKGPGSIEGLGKKFTPSLSSGTASYGIDIQVPPSSAGFGPALSLVYQGGASVSELGMGWKLGGLVEIRRRTEQGLPKFDASDVFELAGIGVPCDLVEVAPKTYRPVEEHGSFARVTRSGSSDTWEARDKAGTTYRLGGEGFEETENGKVVTYLLREQRDLHGHVIAYEWDTSGGYALLQKVVWNDFDASARNEIEFSYDSRPDPLETFSSGIRQALTQVVSSIDVRHGGKLVRRYSLDYGLHGAHASLERVTLFGSDGTTSLPALQLTYTQPSFATTGQVVAMQGAPGQTPADANVDLADLDGDGLPDLLVTKPGAYRSYLNQDGKSWLPGQDWTSGNSPSLTLESLGVQLADVDGDGALDLLAKSGVGNFRYFPGQSASSFGSSIQIPTVPNFELDDPNVQLADMDGDRRVDAVITTLAGLAIGYNDNGTDWKAPQSLGVIDPKQPLMLSDSHTSLCDVNGDHVLDFCYLTTGSLAYWLGRGRGVFEPARSGTGIPSFELSNPWQLRDLDGDGWVDLVRVGVNQIEYALAIAPGAFDAPRAIGDVPEKGPSSVVRFADMNGSGTADIVWIDVSGSASLAWRYLELFPDGRAGLLSRIDNGLGSVTEIEYGPAALDAAKARKAGEPWTTRIEVAMPVVKKVSVDTGLGDPAMVNEYTYRDGTYDAELRTFACFGGGEERSLGDEFTPTLITQSTFEVGAEHRVLRGSISSVESRDETGRIFGRSERKYEVVTLATGMDGRPVEFAYKSSETKHVVEGTDVTQGRTTRTDWVEDEFGNVTAEYEWGEIVGDDLLAGNDERITKRTYANHEEDWILGRIASVEVEDASGTRLSLERTYYDGTPFQGLPLGKVTRGDISRIELWIGPGNDDVVLKEAFAYDSDGNPTERRDALGARQLWVWSGIDHTSLESETFDLGNRELTTKGSIDPAFGTLTSMTGADGQTTKLRVDAFGRVAAVARPGDTLDSPTVAYTYEPGAPLSRVISESRSFSGRDELERKEELQDGLGRKRGALVRDDDDRWVLQGAPLFDARGNARRALRARFVTAAEHADPPLLTATTGTDEWRDASGRTIRTRTPLGLESKTVYVPFGSQTWDAAQNDPSSSYEHTPVSKLEDGLGRTIAVSYTLDSKPLAETYVYDAAGRMLQKTDPEGHTWKFTYDGRGLRLSIDDPDAGKHTLTYDAAGNRIEHRRPDGSVGKKTYDAAGRELTDDWDGDGTPETEMQYDVDPSAPNDLSFRGRLVGTTEPSGSTTQSYDARGNPATVRYVVDGHMYEVGTRADAQDRVYLSTFPDGSSLRIHRNQRGLVSAYGQAIELAYDADGVETQRSFDTGVLEQHGYDDDRRLDETRVQAPNGSILQHLEWTRDGASNVLGVKDKRPNITAKLDRTESYAYDNLYRLKNATGTWGQTSWSYSPSGNTTARQSTIPEQNAGTMSFGQNAGPHAMTSFMGRSIAYDALGRITNDGKRQYSWDAASNLKNVKHTNGASVDNVFSANHERRIKVERDSSGVEHTTYFLSPWVEVKDGELVRYIVHDGIRIARLAPETGKPSATPPVVRDVPRVPTLPLPWLLFALFGVGVLGALRLLGRIPRASLALALVVMGCNGSDPSDREPLPEGTIVHLSARDSLLLYDLLGSLTEVVSGTGELVATAAVYPYGETRFDTATETTKYTSVPRDTSVGLDHMQKRWYAPELGAWTSVDPLNWTDPTKKAGMPFAAANPYAYANAQPTTTFDRNGECPPCIIIAAAAIAGGCAGWGEYDRQAAVGETNYWKVAGVGAIAGLSTMPVGRGFTAVTFAAHGMRAARISVAAYGATTLVTGEDFDISYAAQGAAFSFVTGGFFGSTWKNTIAGWDRSGWERAMIRTSDRQVQWIEFGLTTGLDALKGIVTQKSKPSTPSKLSVKSFTPEITPLPPGALSKAPDAGSQWAGDVVSDLHQQSSCMLGKCP